MTRVLDKSGQLIKALSEPKNSIRDGTMSGGMIPKVETGVEAIERGVDGVIHNGNLDHSVILAIRWPGPVIASSVRHPQGQGYPPWLHGDRRPPLCAERARPAT